MKYIFLPDTAIWQKLRNDKLFYEFKNINNVELEKYNVPSSIADIYQLIKISKNKFNNKSKFYLVIDKKIDCFLMLHGYFFFLMFNAEIIYIQHSDFQFGKWDFTWKKGWFKRNWRFKIKENISKSLRSFFLMIILIKLNNTNLIFKYFKFFRFIFSGKKGLNIYYSNEAFKSEKSKHDKEFKLAASPFSKLKNKQLSSNHIEIKKNKAIIYYSSGSFGQKINKKIIDSELGLINLIRTFCIRNNIKFFIKAKLKEVDYFQDSNFLKNLIQNKNLENINFYSIIHCDSMASIECLNLQRPFLVYSLFKNRGPCSRFLTEIGIPFLEVSKFNNQMISLLKTEDFKLEENYKKFSRNKLFFSQTKENLKEVSLILKNFIL